MQPPKPIEKLNEITSIWNDYILEYTFLQKRINFTEEVATNYYGDIMRYLKDTYSLLKVKKGKSDFESNVFHTVGLLQIIYVQQDLIDELLYIFKLEKSLREDKEPNRKIRNELIGHPVRRGKMEGNPLISSVMFSGELNNEVISYGKYSKENSFSIEIIKIETASLIERHLYFLDKYFKKILNKLNSLLLQYKKKLLNLVQLINQERPIKKIILLSDQIFEAFYKTSRLYTKENLLAIAEKKTVHKRYDYALKTFSRELMDGLAYVLEDIYEKIEGSRVIEEIEKNQFETLENKRKKLSRELHYIRNTRYGYEFEKLAERSGLITPEDLMERFSEDLGILEELRNMRTATNMEFYCSLNYMKMLHATSQ